MSTRIPGMKQRAVAALAAALVLACAAAPAARAADDPHDPIEGFNRAIFKVNDTLDVYLLEPVAKGWDYLLPDPAQQSLHNVFANARYPITLVNSLLQGKPKVSATATGRFLLNSTLGMGGLFDVATGTGLAEHEEDSGQTMGVWGAGGSPYLMLPLLGPSNPRDGVGWVADSFMRVWPYFVEAPVVWTVGAVEVVNARSLSLETVKAAKDTSLDYYSFVRNAYSQHREAEIQDSPIADQQKEEDLYYFDDADE